MGETNKFVGDLTESDEHCKQVIELLGHIGGKWSVLVVYALARGGTLRYNELLREVSGVSQRMLTLTLKVLEQDGLVKRTIYPTVPPRVDYELTALGLNLTIPLRVLYEWAMAHREEMLAARKTFLSRAMAPAGA